MNREAVHTLLFCAVIVITGLVAAVNVRSFRVPERVDVIDGGFAKAFEQHYEDEFPVKRLGVNLWAAIDYALFREGRPGIVVGTHDWLYTDEEFNVGDDYDASIRANFARISDVRKQLSDAGVELLAAVVPAKARIYPEYLSGRMPAAPHAALYDETLAALSAAGIPTADLRGTLSAGKAYQQTFLRTDTHWAPWGAQLAAIEIANIAGAAGLLRSLGTHFVTHVSGVDMHRGDLFSFLPLDPYFTPLLPPREEIQLMKTDVLVADGDSLVAEGDVASSTAADLFGDSELPEVVLIGTSYSANPLWNFVGFLKQFLGEDVASYAREGAGPFAPMATYLRSEDFRARRPRLVIWEIPERSILVSPPAVAAR